MRSNIFFFATLLLFVGYTFAEPSLSVVCYGPAEISVSCKKQCQPKCDNITGIKPQETCVPDDKCTPGCDCFPGYFRNRFEICVKAEACPCPKANYQVVQCPNPCPGGTCESPEFLQCNATCEEYGCQCKEGHVKDENGNCIQIAMCPPKCDGKNELLSPCKDLCPLTCKGIKSNKPEQQGCFPAPCVAGCNCAPGFARNANSKCIKPGNCRCGDPNAEVVSCPNPCPGGTCESPKFSKCDLPCKTFGCQCKEGFVKDSDGKCILLSQCPPVCKGFNEIAVSCKKQCQRTCENFTSDKPQEICVPDGKCTPGCDCLPGHFRTLLGYCVEPESCYCSKPNYRVVKCPNPCPGGTCETPEFLQCNATCKEYGCQCKEGHLKDNRGNCVPIETCPPKCEGKNEVSSPCTDQCPLTCKGIASDNPEQGCFPAPCVAGCNCAPGFARNVNGVCIKPKNCRCGDPNAEVVDCPNPCPGGTCEEPDKSSCKLRCPPLGCQCKGGFVKDSNGKCISLSQCVPVCNGPGETAVSCKNQCQPTCDNITSNKPQEKCIPDDRCIPGCDCLPGYFRNGSNICIKAESCLCPYAYNQVVKCPNPCPGGTCETPEFLDCGASCKEYGCQCKEGRVKDKQGNCVLLENCPLKCEGKNEVSSLCRDFCPLTCKGIVLNKPEQQGCFPAPCVAGCNCAIGFVRNVNDVCIQPGKCRCGDPNAEVVQCPNPCLGGTCEQPEFSLCTDRCAAYGCQCKKGHVKDSNGKCVPLSECRQ